MTRSSVLLLSLLSFATLSTSAASAQTAGHVALRGEVHGVELALEGGLHAPRGTTLRWLATAYEVVGLSELRLAPRAEIQVTTALDPTAAPLVFPVDAHARVQIDLPIPDDAPEVFGVVIRVVSGSAQRRFELSIYTSDPRDLRLWLARDAVPQDGIVHAFGRLRMRASDGPIAGETVRLTLQDGAARPVGAPVEVVTDASGLFAHGFQVPHDLTGAASVVAAVGDRRHRLTQTVAVTIGDARIVPMIVSVAPERLLLEPDSSVGVEVVVRTGDGQPVEGARVEWPPLRYDERPGVATTDARGHAHFTWRAPSTSAPYTDTAVNVSVSREGVGATSGTALVRIARVERAASFGVEGGALVPSLGGRIYARVLDVDGSAAPAGVQVQVQGPRITARTASTDASGIAVFDVTLDALGADETDRCGGDAATAITIDASGATALEGCVPLDPDGSLRVRAASPTVLAGRTAHFEIARTSGVARLPISVSIVSLEGQPLAIGETVVPGTASSFDLPIPEGRTGVFVLRARPLHGPAHRDLRGGSTSFWVLPGELYALTASIGSMGAEIERRPDARAYVAALPIDEAHQLAARLRTELLRAFGDLRVEPADATPALFEATLAVVTPLDVSAPWVLRGTVVSPVPAPATPAELGLLRDPWRSQARFVEGRLALVFQAIERYVAAAVPERIDDVAVSTGGRWDFNAQILAAVADSGELGPEGATGLGGEDLTVASLRAFDTAFSYDAVARRITRERLFRLLVALRSYVRQQGFDLPWARLGDPTTWLAHTTELYVEGVGQIQARELVDAWGHPFVLRPVTGAPRFGSWSPLSGWEVLSTGPDGNAGNGDDVFDPTARVLPSTSTYARAVGEDALVARLAGVELGRAAVGLLGQYQGAYAQGVPSSPEAAGVARGLLVWQDVPSVFQGVEAPLALRRPNVGTIGAGGVIAALDGTVVPLTFDEEPRTWGLVALAYTSAGIPAIAEAHAVRGSPLIVHARFPTRLHADEPIEVEVAITNTSEVARTVAVSVEGDGPLTGDGADSLHIDAGTAETTRISLRPTDTGHAHAIVVLREGGAALRTLRYELAIDSGLHPIRARSAGITIGNHYATHVELSSAARRTTGRVVLIAPSSLYRDPDLAEVRERDPALLAWSAVLAGHGLDESLRADLLRAQSSDGHLDGDEPLLSTACALVAWSAADVEDEGAAGARARAIQALQYGAQFADADSEAGLVRAEAAVLAALAPSGIADLADGSEGDLDPVARFTAQHRARLRRVLRRYPEEPTLLARAAAALLLADPRDSYGRAMYEAAARHLEDYGGGRLVSASETRDDVIEEITASLALAVAAHQLEQDDLARSLVRAAVARDNLITAEGGEPLFWLLANAAYGVLGSGEPTSARVSAGGRTTDAQFDHGVAIVPIDHLSGSFGVDVTTTGDAIALVRAEAVYVEPFTPRTEGPVELVLEGDPGAGDGMSALELVVRARREVRTPIVLLELPTGIEVDDARVLSQLASASGVQRVEPRRPGMVRIVLAPMGAGTEIRIPLALRWSVYGRIQGLAAVGLDAEDPHRRTVIAPITIDRTSGN